MKARDLVCVLSVFATLTGCHHHYQLAGTAAWQPDPPYAAQLTAEENNGNGIEVGAPKVYDDASLRMMLDATRAKLATMSGLSQDALISRLGSISGATISQTQFGLQVAGPSAPGVTHTSTGATSSLTTNANLQANNTTIPGTVTVTTEPTQTVVTTSAGAAPPATPAVPSGLAFTPPTSVSPSAMDVLNEQMQLSYEMANLQLLLEGALSDRFVLNQRFVKPRVTLGFPISLRTPAQFRDAAAVVEVEVTMGKGNLSDEAPAITALLPREKTYNVAAMTDHTTSIGAGAVIGMVGVSGSFLYGRKTLYIVEDQDTVALQRPADPGKPNVSSFLWEFRPVLGQHFVRGGMKQTFVQLAMPTLESVNCFGSIQIRTYWRRFDQKQGTTGNVIPESVLVSRRTFSIPRFDLSPRVDAINYEDLGDGSVLVSVNGNYLAGTYVQLGPVRYDAGKNLIVEDSGVKFTVPAAALSRWTGHIVARSGAQSDLLAPLAQHPLPLLDQTSCAGAETASRAEAKTDLPPPTSSTWWQERLEIVGAKAEPLNETDSILRVEMATDYFDRKSANRPSGCVWLNQSDKPAPVFADWDELLLAVGGKVYGLRDAPLKRETSRSGGAISTVVPTALLIANPKVRVFRPFWSDMDGDGAHCYDTKYDLQQFGLGSATEHLVLVSLDADGSAVYVLYGDGLGNAKLLIPEKDAALEQVDGVSPGHIRLLRIKKSALLTTKKVVLQKEANQQPLLLELPEAKPTAPKVSVDSPVILNTNEIEVSAEQAGDVANVKLDDKVLKWKPVDKSTIRLLNLKADGVTNEQKSREITIEYKSGAKATLKFEVVAARIGVK